MRGNFNNILVTGGAGYIGSHLIERLKKKVIIVDNLSTGSEELINKKSLFINEDISNTDKIVNIILKFKIETIIHLAASLSVEESVSNPQKYYENNINGTISILKACKSSCVKNIIFSSTAAVYGDQKKGKYNENDLTFPENPYGLSKLISEELIKKFCKLNKINYGILRYFNVVGSNYKKNIGQINSSDHLFKNCAKSIIKNKKIKIYGTDYTTEDGTAIRDYIHVNDLADIHLIILNYISKKFSITINCGYGHGYSVKNIVNEFLKYNKKIKVIYQKRRSGDASKVIADSNILKKKFKWKPKFNNISKMVKDTIVWEKYLDSK